MNTKIEGAINYDAVKVPASFKSRMAKTYIGLIKAVIATFSRAIAEMKRSRQSTLIRFRSRAVTYARQLGVEDWMIQRACEPQGSLDWAKELNQLVSFEVAQVILPVYYGRGNFDATESLRRMVRYLLLNEDENSIYKIVDKDAAVLLLNQSAEYKKSLVRVFLQQALVLATKDAGRFLAGLTYQIWMTKGQDLTAMYQRNLYKRRKGFFGIWSWRQWLQEEILGLKNSDPAKETFKAMIEQATNRNRRAPLKLVSATDMARYLENYAEEPVGSDVGETISVEYPTV